MKLTAFGEKFGGRSGIGELMDDLGQALRENPDMIFMGGGNPARIPELEHCFEQKLEALLQSPQSRHQLLGIYQSKQGEKAARQALASYLKRHFGWAVNEHNIAFANGSQNACFILYNLFAGQMADGSQRTLHLPLVPEYLGYRDIGLSRDFFTATKPTIELIDQQQFKYHVDLNALSVGEQCGAISVSRPTNPTANVLSDDEIDALQALCKQRNIPLIVDGAYGLPFPNIVFGQAAPRWDEQTVLMLSLSKLGLPGIRSGIVVASEEIISAFNNANSIVNLASSTIGPALLAELLKDDQIDQLSRTVVQPFYRDRAAATMTLLQAQLAGLPARIHKPEGAIFLWLWLDELPIASYSLYQSLKARGVLVVPGEDFFIGVDPQWHHQRQCLRLSYAADPAVIARGVEIIGEEVRRAYAG